MRPGGGKAKGAGFERLISKLFSQWLTNGERDDLFWRSAMSGGRATVMRRAGRSNQTQAGDISAVDPLAHKLTNIFVIECKNVKSLDLTQALLKGKGAFILFWKQVKRDAGADRYPMLVAHQNKMPTIVAVERHAARHVLKINKEARFQIYMGKDQDTVCVYLLEDVLKSPCQL